jgi:hypothetical protein
MSEKHNVQTCAGHDCDGYDDDNSNSMTTVTITIITKCDI